MTHADRLKVLFVAAEIYPLAKAGGLGDVAGALPAALARIGVDVRLMMPGYPSALQRARDLAPDPVAADLQVGSRPDDPRRSGDVELMLGRTPDTNLPLWLVRCPRLYERAGGPYADENGAAWPDNAERFALLCNVAANLASAGGNWTPDVIHANDWHAALVPGLLEAHLSKVASLLTIHNIAHQGHASPEQLRAFGLPADQLRGSQASHSFLAQGIASADCVTTVSPTYAKEIQTPKFGCGLERLVAARLSDLVGILNGVNYSVWDPARDELIAHKYDESSLTGKALCKTALLEEMNLDSSSFAPLFGIVSRFSWQKGLDLVADIADILVAAGARLVVLGQGDPELEQRFRALATRYSKRIAVHIRHDEALAHRILAGVDIFLMPSRFEPCGLNQMYGLRYGTPPVVTRVGGLADTVVDAGQRGIARGATTGFAMRGFSPASLAVAAGRAMAAFAIRALWESLQHTGMRQDFSWERSAQQYRDLYARLIS
jgi:starch synthase